MNSHSIHFCCSYTEGFGHHINEGKSCKALILTTNKAPMNEIDSNNGLLIPSIYSIPLEHTLDDKYYINKDLFKKNYILDFAKHSNFNLYNTLSHIFWK